MAYVLGPLNSAFPVEVGVLFPTGNRLFVKVGVTVYVQSTLFKSGYIEKVVPDRVDPARAYNFGSPKGVNGYSGGGGSVIPTYGQIFPSGR